MTTEELNALIAQAESGDVPAMNQLTHIYGEEEGFINHEQAAKWFFELINRDCNLNSGVYENTGYNKGLYGKIKNAVLNSVTEGDMLSSLSGCPAGGSLLGGAMHFTTSNAKSYINQAEEAIQHNIEYKEEQRRIAAEEEVRKRAEEERLRREAEERAKREREERERQEREKRAEEERLRRKAAEEEARKKAEESAIQKIIETGSGFGKMKLTGTFVIPAGTKKIGDASFHGRRGLTSVIIPSGVTSIGEKAFYDCVKLTQVKIPSSVKNIKYRAFQGCESLETIDLPNGLTSIGEYAFHKCKKLITIHIPKNVKTIGNWAFSDCSNLMSVELHWGVKIGIWAFSNCRKLKTIFVPKGLKSYFVSLLKGVHFPANVKIVEK